MKYSCLDAGAAISREVASGANRGSGGTAHSPPSLLAAPAATMFAEQEGRGWRVVSRASINESFPLSGPDREVHTKVLPLIAAAEISRPEENSTTTRDPLVLWRSERTRQKNTKFPTTSKDSVFFWRVLRVSGEVTGECKEGARVVGMIARRHGTKATPL